MKYPIYIPSLGRFNKLLTVSFLAKNSLNCTLVVEPHEIVQYEAAIAALGYATKVIALPQSHYKCSSFARNFALADAKKRGFKKCWMLDDDLSNIYQHQKGKKIGTPLIEIFEAMEYTSDKIPNLIIASVSATNFSGQKKHLVRFNTFAYGCFLVHTSPYKFTRDVIIDLDFCLQVLEDGNQTARFDGYCFSTSSTGKNSGGYTTADAAGRRLKRIQNTLAAWPILGGPEKIYKDPTLGVYKLNSRSVWNRYRHISYGA